MKKILLMVFVGIAAGLWAVQAYASDWVVSGSRDRQEGGKYGQVHERREYGRSVWVPHYVLVWEYIPAHREYSARYGRMILMSGRYVQRQVERGGHWEVRARGR